MAGEVKHKDVGPELTYDEYHSADSHTIDGVEAGTVIAGKTTLVEVKADTDIVDAISKSHSNTLDHTQGTDQGLDTGGVNAVTAAEVKGAVTNSHAPGSDNQVIPDSLSDLSDDSTHRLVTDTEKSTWNAKSNLTLGEIETTAYRGDRGKTAYDHSQVAHAPSTAEANVNADWSASSGDAQILNKPTIPDELADLSDDSTHRLVTDTEKSTWNGKTDLATVKADTDIVSAISLKHAAVTLGTANGLSLSTQELSLAAATSGNAGAATATQISKLDGIEALADVTDATNVAAAGAVMEGDTTTASMSFVIDEDDMASNLDTKVPTQQSVKAYVDASSGVQKGGKRQTVLSSKLSSGLPVFITDPNDGLKVNIDVDANAPVVITFAAGFSTTGPTDYIGAIEADTNISSLTDNATCYLYASRNPGTGAISLGHVTVAPVYDYVAPSHAANQYWFSIAEMKMYLSNGSDTWTEVQVVFIGEAVTSSGQVTSVVNYALCGRYDSGWFAVATETDYSKNHNIGVKMPWVTIYGAYSNFNTQGEPPAWVYIAGSGYFGVRRLMSDSTKTISCQTQAYILYSGGWQTTNCYLRILADRGW